MGQRSERLAALSGVGFAVLAVVGWALAHLGAPGEWLAPADQLVRYYEGHHDDVLIGTTLLIVSVFFLLWFLGGTATALRRAEGGDGRLASIAFGGGAVGAALLLAGAATRAVPAFRADEDGTVAPVVATALSDTGDYLGGAGAPLAFGVLVAATAVVGFRYGPLPLWFSSVSAVLAAGLVLPVVPWVAMMAFPLWVLVLSVMLNRRQPRAMPPRLDRDVGEPGPVPAGGSRARATR